MFFLKKGYRFSAKFLSVLMVVLTACNNPGREGDTSTNTDNTSKTEKKPVVPKFSTYKDAIQAMREQKDKHLMGGEILDPEKKPEFKGLKYFDPDTSFIFKASIELLKPEKVIFKTTDEREPEYYRFCKLTFTKNGVSQSLNGFVENAESPESIFIPFRDATNNNETYGGGRYIDLHYNGEKTLVLLDLNYAYNPYCHYNHNYSCPLVPKENILTIPIFAGEKKLYE